MPPELILEIIGKMEFPEIKRLCKRYPSFQNVCVDNKNSIAQRIFDTHKFEFDENIKGRQFEILRKLCEYNPDLRDDKWGDFLEYGDLDTIKLFKNNIKEKTYTQAMTTLVKASHSLPIGDDKMQHIMRFLEVSLVFIQTAVFTKYRNGPNLLDGVKSKIREFYYDENSIAQSYKPRMKEIYKSLCVIKPKDCVDLS
jgi:hypothetical protein